MICPCCGTEMEKGWLFAQPPILWTQNPASLRTQLLSHVVTAEEDLRLPKDKTGRTPMWNCPHCRKLVVDY